MKPILFSLILLIGCGRGSADIPGTYCSKKPNTWERILNFPFYKAIAQGESLELRKDFTFEYHTCTQISKGRWQQNSDALLLYCSEQRFLIDSFNHKPEYAQGTKCWAGPVIFRIKKGTLSRVLKMKDGRYMNCLEKK